MKKTAAILLLLLATACMKKEADGTYRITNPIDKKNADTARHNAAKSGDQVDKVMKKVEQGADKLAVKAGKGLEKAGKKLEEKGKTDTHR